MSRPNADNKSITKPRTHEEVREALTHRRTTTDPLVVLDEADKELHKHGSGANYDLSPQNNLFKALTLLEFENGVLLTAVVKEQYATFGIDMMRQLQKEYACTSISEKALAELVTISYIRPLEIQARINSYLSMGSFTGDGVRYLAVMSKELDRAHRHYMTAIQTLRSMRQPPMQVKINADTAIVGQNQVVQATHD